MLMLTLAFSNNFFPIMFLKTNSAYFPETPFGLLPVLFIDDTPLPQTGATVRFLAKSLKLEPENNLQNAFADMIFETIHEALFEKIRVPFMEKDEVKKVKQILTLDSFAQQLLSTFCQPTLATCLRQ